MKKLLFPFIGIIIVVILYSISVKKEQHYLQQKEESFQKYCSNKYEELQQEFEDAKGFFNDDEKRIAHIKTEAISLRNKGCDKYLGGSLSKLIQKCDDEL